MALLASTVLDISIIDSQTDPGSSYILVGDCAAKVKTRDIKDNPDKVVKQVNDFCGLELSNVSKEK